MMASFYDPYRGGHPLISGVSRAVFGGVEVFRDLDESEHEFLARALLAARQSRCSYFDVFGSYSTEEAA